MRILLLSMACVLAGCAGNPYGFARTYDALSEEDDYYERTGLTTYEDVRRAPTDHQGVLVGWFGIVTAAGPASEGGDPSVLRVQVSHRVHQERHLCADERASSCRVTVSDRSNGNFAAVLHLRPEDVGGTDRVNVGSLVKIYGTPEPELDDNGDPVLSVRYYRHWPRGTFVTTVARDSMRR